VEQRKRKKYYVIHKTIIQGNNILCVFDNSFNRSTLLKDAPIFLDSASAWKWLEKNYPNDLFYIRPEQVEVG
jgi:hypothetical protein